MWSWFQRLAEELGRAEKNDGADGNEAPLEHVIDHGVGIEAGVEADVGEHVHRGVEEGEESEQAAELDEPTEARPKLTQRGDGQRGDEEIEGEIAGGEFDVGGGIGAEVVCDGQVRERSHGVEAEEPGGGLEEDERRFLHGTERS